MRVTSIFTCTIVYQPVTTSIYMSHGSSVVQRYHRCLASESHLVLYRKFKKLIIN